MYRLIIGAKNNFERDIKRFSKKYTHCLSMENMDKSNKYGLIGIQYDFNQNINYKNTIQFISEYKNKFNIIVCDFAVEDKINDIDNFIQIFKKVLSNKGKLILTCPRYPTYFSEYWKYAKEVYIRHNLETQFRAMKDQEKVKFNKDNWYPILVSDFKNYCLNSKEIKNINIRIKTLYLEDMKKIYNSQFSEIYINEIHPIKNEKFMFRDENINDLFNPCIMLIK